MRFTTHVFPQEQRKDAWRFALKRVSISLQAIAEEQLYGELIRVRGAIGMNFIRLTGTAQQWLVDMRENPDFFWMIIMLGGSAEISGEEDVIRITEGDMICAPGKEPVLLSFPGEHHILWVQIPDHVLDQRFKTPLPDRLSVISGENGFAHVLVAMLRGVADIMQEGTGENMRPVEMAMPEFLLASLLQNAPARALGGAAGIRAALLERIFQTIEMKLADPGLSYQKIANEHGISPRYLQKLFESIGDNFGHYVKVRRLERCRLDLLSPLHAQKSISDILFQWGFNDSASFSRAFREQYGISPREYRKRASLSDADG